MSLQEVRIDQWLWAARLFRTRPLARQAIERGQVRVAGQACKPSRAVRVGDAIELERAGDRYEVTVLALSLRRGPAGVARALYDESEASVRAREQARAQRQAVAAGYRAPAGRPDKRARRLIKALGDIDTLL